MIIPSAKDIVWMTDRAAWRSWLEKNHAKRPSVWIRFFKKHTGKSSLSYNDAVEEALCFGWIDSLVKKLDEERYIQKFTPRKKNSAWSQSNKKRVRDMMRQGKMTEAGLAKVAEAKKDGSWTRLDALEQLTGMPPGLANALRTAPAAGRNFRAMSPSNRKQFLWFVESAVREETRKKRVKAVVGLLAANRTMSGYFYEKRKPRISE